MRLRAFGVPFCLLAFTPLATGQVQSGTAQAWGRNTFGELGDGALTSRTTPV